MQKNAEQSTAIIKLREAVSVCLGRFEVQAATERAWAEIAHKEHHLGMAEELDRFAAYLRSTLTTTNQSGLSL